jgi:hypothetical protein
VNDIWNASGLVGLVGLIGIVGVGFLFGIGFHIAALMVDVVRRMGRR